MRESIAFGRRPEDGGGSGVNSSRLESSISLSPYLTSPSRPIVLATTNTQNRKRERETARSAATYMAVQESRSSACLGGRDSRRSWNAACSEDDDDEPRAVRGLRRMFPALDYVFGPLSGERVTFLAQWFGTRISDYLLLEGALESL